MAPLADPKMTEAVAMAIKDDLCARTAWELVGKPGGEKSIQNIRKRIREEKERRASNGEPSQDLSASQDSSAPHTAETVTPLPPGVPPRKNNEKVPFRRSSSQVDKDETAEFARKKKYINALKSASAEYQKSVTTGQLHSAEKLASKYNMDQHLGVNGVKKLTGQRINNYVRNGYAGLSPPGKGPTKRAIPNQIVALVSSHTSMAQLNGDERNPRAIKRTAMALVKDTEYEKHLSSQGQKRKFLKRLRKSLDKVPKLLVDNRRWLYLTYANVDRYFDGLKAFYLAEGFGDDEPCVYSDGSVSEITFHDYALPRLSNGDETNQELSNVGDKSGPRATTFVDPRIPRSGSRQVVSQKHVTTYIMVNGADEVGTFVAIFDTTASVEEDRKVHISWTAGLPRVQAQWGHPDVCIHEPVVLVTPNGGTSEDALEKIIESALIPLYPNISPTWKFDDDGNFLAGPICHRLDGGPGRVGQSSLPMRMRLAEKGVFLFPSGPQNCTAATQECDQLFDTYKGACDEVTDDIVAERIAARASEEAKLRENGGPADRRRSGKSALPKVELTNADLPRIVNGRPDDPIEKRPFSLAFNSEKVHKANAKVGAVPLTRAALKSPKVRKELESTEEASGIARTIANEHATNLAAGKALGLNTQVAEAELPRRYEVVAPPTTKEEVIQALIEGKASHAAMWVNCGAVAFNGSVMNKAGLALAKEAHSKKVDASNATLSIFEELKAKASSIWSRMYNEQIGSYDELASGEPKVLVQFWHRAKGVTGIAKYQSVKDQTTFLDTIEDEEFERLLELDVPLGFKAVDHEQEVAAELLKQMSTSLRQTISYVEQPERETVLALTGLNGAVDAERGEDVNELVSAADTGFDASLLPANALLFKVPPSDEMLEFQSESGGQLNGLEIVRKFKEYGWCIGCVLKQASDASVKDQKRVTNYRVFYEEDDAFINQSLYAANYAKGASSAIRSHRHVDAHLQPWPRAASTHSGRTTTILDATTANADLTCGQEAALASRRPPSIVRFDSIIFITYWRLASGCNIIAFTIRDCDVVVLGVR